MSLLDSSIIEDIEAVEFALALMLPDDLLREYLAAHPAVAAFDDGALQAMAKKFQMPLLALGIRLGDIRRRT